jgi:hypothetical protein
MSFIRAQAASTCRGACQGYSTMIGVTDDVLLQARRAVQAREGRRRLHSSFQAWISCLATFSTVGSNAKEAQDHFDISMFAKHNTRSIDYADPLSSLLKNSPSSYSPPTRRTPSHSSPPTSPAQSCLSTTPLAFPAVQVADPHNAARWQARRPVQRHPSARRDLWVS